MLNLNSLDTHLTNILGENYREDYHNSFSQLVVRVARNYNRPSESPIYRKAPSNFRISYNSGVSYSTSTVYNKVITIPDSIQQIINSINPIELEFSDNMEYTYIGMDTEQLPVDPNKYYQKYTTNLTQQSLILGVLILLGFKHRFLKDQNPDRNAIIQVTKG